MNHTTREDDFFDFDELSEPSSDVIENQQTLMHQFNESHEALSTKEFLNEYEHLMAEIPLDLEEIDRLVMHKFNLEDDTLNLQDSLEDIKEFLGLMSSFLHQFSEFGELDQALGSLVELIYEIELDQLDTETKELLGIYMKAIIMDLIEWKEHVFIEQDAGNVFYANASLLNSYIEVKKLLQS